MKIALVQMPVVDDKKQNLDTAADYVRTAAENGAQLVMLPEMFCCPYSNRFFPRYAEDANALIGTTLSRIAKENRVVLVGGSMPERDGDRIYNTSFVFDESGAPLARHRKMHLFDIDVKGGQSFRESDTFMPGRDVTVFDCSLGRFGLMICFDIRFPELSRLMSLDGAEMILVPAAFNMTTGPAHWELSFRQRALDNQLFMAGCAPARDENGVYVSYANSIVTGPWGDVLARAGEEAGILYADVDLTENQRIREQLPLLKARRTDLYRMEKL